MCQKTPGIDLLLYQLFLSVSKDYPSLCYYFTKKIDFLFPVTLYYFFLFADFEILLFNISCYDEEMCWKLQDDGSALNQCHSQCEHAYMHDVTIYHHLPRT